MRVTTYKACDFCRHRKRKCVTSSPSSNQCDLCLELEIPCCKSSKPRSTKLRERRRKLAASVLGYVEEVTPESISDLERFTPFFTELRTDDLDCGPLITIASELLKSSDQKQTTQLMQRAFEILSLSNISYEMAETSLLLLCRLPVPPIVVHRVYDRLMQNCTILELPLPVSAGTIAANAWMTYLNFTTYDMGTSLVDQLLVLERFKQTLGDTFARQYIILTILLLRMQILDRQGQPDMMHGLSWLQVEHDFLMVPLHVPSYLIDLRDDFPGTPFGRILHIMVNTINFDFYLRILKSPVLQKMTQLRPIPGLFHFMLAMAKTAFLYGNEVIEKWTLLSYCRAKLVPMVFELYELCELENCKEVLSLWKDTHNEFPELYKTVQKLIGDPPWICEKHSGYSVFWIFRDMRCLHVEGLLQQQVDAQGQDSDSQAPVLHR